MLRNRNIFIKCPKLSLPKTQITLRPPIQRTHHSEGNVKCKDSKELSDARPNWTHIYLSNQQTAAGLASLAGMESSLFLVQIKNTKLIPLTMPHAATSHRAWPGEEEHRKEKWAWLWELGLFGLTRCKLNGS